MRFSRLLAALIFGFLITLTMVSCSTKTQTTPPITGLVYLGYGYDVFGEYAKPSGIKARIFDLGANNDTVSFNGSNYSKPKDVELLPNNEAFISSVFGDGYYKFLQSYELNATISTGYLFWQDTLKVDFQYSQSETTSYYYHKLYQIFKKYTLRLPTAGSAAFNSMINAGFKSDLNTMEPYALFDKYGTHYLAEVVIGARCDYNAKTTKNADTMAISGQIQYCGNSCFKSIGGMDIDVDAGGSAALNTYNNNTQITIRALGGRSEYADDIRSKSDFDKWLESINTNNLTLCNFTSNSLRPIWDLCADSARKKVLEDAFNTYAEGKQLTGMDGGNECMMNLIVVTGGSATVNVPQGYTKLGTDLNKGCGGDSDYIYLCYQKGLDTSTNPYPITDLTLVRGEGVAAPMGYAKINVDLNKNAGGDFIYLCYKRDPAKATTPIRDIKIIVGENVQAPTGYSVGTWWGTNTTADLNRNAGGDFIYLAYTTQQ